jgi:hypothetical protein
VCGHGTDGAPQPTRPAVQGARACDFQSDAIANNGTIHSAATGLVSRGEASIDDTMMCADDRIGERNKRGTGTCAVEREALSGSATRRRGAGHDGPDSTDARNRGARVDGLVPVVRHERHDGGLCGRESGMDDDGEVADGGDDTWHRRVAGARPAPTVASPPPPAAPAFCVDVTQDGMPTS